MADHARKWHNRMRYSGKSAYPSDWRRSRWCAGLVGILVIGMGGCMGGTAAYREGSGSSVSPSGPNVVVVLCDDLGAFDLGCTGSEKTRTPNIDALRKSGVLFERGYSSASVCAPSRAAMLTGKSMAHCQIRDNREAPNLVDGTFGGQYSLQAASETVARALQRAGYATGAFGKWGLGGIGASTGHPLDQGFDRFSGVLCQRNAHNHYPAYMDRDRSKVVLQGNDRGLVGCHYLNDVVAEEAVEWMESVKDRPFFLYFASPLPHLALQAPDAAVDDYTFPESAYDGNNGYLAHSRPHAAYAAMVARLDAAVGALVHKLDELGVRNNTLIFFTSDNGATFELGGFDPKFFESNRGLRGHKGQLYEGGIRVPFIASWPGRIAPGASCDRAVVGYDIFPTVLAAAQVAPRSEPDGMDLLPVLLGRSPCDQLERRPPIVWEQPAGDGWQAVLDGKWKLIRRHAKNAEKQAWELFDMSLDPGETTNLADTYPEVVARLSRVLEDRSKSSLGEWNYASITVGTPPAER